MKTVAPARTRAILTFLTVLLLVTPAALWGGTANAQDDGGDVYLPLITMRGTPPPHGEPADDLIGDALERGDIDAETALLYRVYAAFGDPRLPTAYQGSRRFALDSDALRAAQAQFASLSAPTQQALRPFFVPPVYPGSWGDPARDTPGLNGATVDPAIGCIENAQTELLPGWARIELTNFYIWYPLDGDTKWGTDAQTVSDAANLIADVMGEVFEAEVTLMGRDIPTDAGLPCNGGDDKFDIYVVRNRMSMSALTIGYPPGCELRPTFMIIAPDVIGNDRDTAETVMAHEFMHTLQLGSYDYAGNCEENVWLDEATAHWAIDYVYPNNNKEHTAETAFTEREHEYSLEEGWTNGFNKNAFGMNGYSDALFFFYVVRKANNPQIIPQIYQKLEGEPDTLKAVNDSIPGGFAERWPEFVLYNWNRAPVGHYRAWDGLNAAYRTGGGDIFAERYRVVAQLGDRTRQTYDMGVYPLQVYDIPHLAARYTYFEFPEEKVRTIVFNNSFVGQQGAKVWGVYRLRGQTQWTVEDWTDKATREFCRDKVYEDITALAVIVGNSEWQDREYYLGEGPTLEVLADGCPCGSLAEIPGWGGHINFDYDMVGDKQYEGTHEEVTVRRGANVNLSFENKEFDDRSSTYWSGEGVVDGVANINDKWVITYDDGDTTTYTTVGQGQPYQFPSGEVEGGVKLLKYPTHCIIEFEVRVYVNAAIDMMQGEILPAAVGVVWMRNYEVDPNDDPNIVQELSLPVVVTNTDTEDLFFLNDGGTYPQGFGELLWQIRGEGNMGLAHAQLELWPLWDPTPTPTP